MKKRYIIILLGFISILIVLSIFLIFYINAFKNQKPHALTNNKNFTIIVLPDTQVYSKDYPDIFTNQTNWIKENKNNLNIQFIIHLGDIVNNYNNISQWDNANSSITILESNNIPFSVIPGNHDSNTKSNYTYYDLYFSKTRFVNKPWYGGSYDNYRNNYALLNINDQDYLFLNLDFCPDNNTIKWANEVLSNYPNHKIILSTHGYLDNSDFPKRNIHVCGSTEYIWNDLIKTHKNLQIVLSGHVHAERLRKDLNDFNKPVYQLLSDYQEDEFGGAGYLRIMTFTQDNKVFVKTYSPYLNTYKLGIKSEFVIELNK